MLFKNLKSPVQEQVSKITNKRKTTSKTKRKKNLTIDQQLDCFAKIIVNQLLKDSNYYEKE